VRITAGTWNLVLGIILLAHGYRWAWLLFVVSALVFSAAYVLARGTSGARRRSQS
jgi:predicted acyltransferase